MNIDTAWLKNKKEKEVLGRITQELFDQELHHFKLFYPK
jgi:hypothetical protein